MLEFEIDPATGDVSCDFDSPPSHDDVAAAIQAAFFAGQLGALKAAAHAAAVTRANRQCRSRIVTMASFVERIVHTSNGGEVH